MIEVDHDAREVSIEQMQSVMGDISGIPPDRASVTARLNAPVSTNQVAMEKISFERNKSGIWGWRSDKIEDVNGYECKAYAASNVEFVSKSRSEHLSAAQASRVSILFLIRIYDEYFVMFSLKARDLQYKAFSAFRMMMQFRLMLRSNGH